VLEDRFDADLSDVEFVEDLIAGVVSSSNGSQINEVISCQRKELSNDEFAERGVWDLELVCDNHGVDEGFHTDVIVDDVFDLQTFNIRWLEASNENLPLEQTPHSSLQHKS